MKALRFTLVADGPSDEALIHPLRWLLIHEGVTRPIEPAWADLRQLPHPPDGLGDRIRWAGQLYPCDILFIHRDAEREARERRVQEIRQALQRLSPDLFGQAPCVCVVPVRMTEAWFLFDESAIRRAAGNPAGRTPLSLPHSSIVESLPDPKQHLYSLLQAATERPARRLKRFSLSQAWYRLAESIDDFSPLLRLSAFTAMRADLRDILEAQGWAGIPQPPGTTD